MTSTDILLLNDSFTQNHSLSMSCHQSLQFQNFKVKIISSQEEMLLGKTWIKTYTIIPLTCHGFNNTDFCFCQSFFFLQVLPLKQSQQTFFFCCCCTLMPTLCLLLSLHVCFFYISTLHHTVLLNLFEEFALFLQQNSWKQILLNYIQL